MLQRMRDGIQGWITWLIIIAIIASLGLLGVNYYLHGQSSDNNAANNTVAKIDSTVVTQQQVNKLYNSLRQQQPDVPPDFASEQNLRQIALHKLIDRALLQKIASQNDFALGDAQLDSIITQLPAFQQDGQFSQARFSAIINQLGYTPEQFMQEIRADVISDQLQAGIAATAFALPNELTLTMQMIKQTRDFSYTVIAANKYRSKITVSDQEILQYYQTHNLHFQTPEKIKLDYLVISADQIAKNIHPDQAELANFYQANISNYSQPPQWKIAHIVVSTAGIDPAAVQTKLKTIQQALQAGAKFATVADRYSDDILSAKQGGVLPWINLNTLSPSLQITVSKLKLGEISAPVQTPNGYEIIQLIDTKKATVLPFEQVENTVRQAYVQQQTQKQFSSLVQQLQDASFQNPDSLEPAAKALAIPIQTTDWLTAAGTKQGLFANAQLLQAAFTDNVRTKNNSGVLYPNPDMAVVLRAHDYVAARLLPIDQVKNKIKELLLQTVSQQQAESVANTIVAELNDRKNMAQITQEYGLQWHAIQHTGRHNTKQKINSAILQAAFDVPRPSAAEKVSAISKILPNNDVVVVAVSAVYDVSPNIIPSAAEKRIYQSQLQSYFGDFSLAEMLSYYRKNTVIKIYQPNAKAAD